VEIDPIDLMNPKTTQRTDKNIVWSTKIQDNIF
jgi:hypothetical protein